MKISITEIRDNLADALNRVAYGGERDLAAARKGRGGLGVHGGAGLAGGVGE